MKHKNNKSLGKNALLNGIKTLCSIIFPFISFTYCSRVLGSEKIGAYSFGHSVISYLLLVAGLGISNYAIREGSSKKDNKDLNKFINEVFSINIISTIISYIILFILLTFVSKINTYKTIILIQSITILLTTLGTDWINTIFEDYLYITIRFIILQLLSLILLLLFVKDPNDIYIYTIITVFASSFGYIINWFYLRKKGIKISLTKKINIKEHIKPILILFANSIASIIYLNSDITMLGFMTDDSKVGIYTISSQIYSMLKRLINAIIMVTLPRFSNIIVKKQTNLYKENLEKILDILVIMSLPISTGLFIEAKKIIILIAGNKYLLGTNVVQVLSIAIFFAVGACFNAYSILIPNKKEKNFMYSTIIAAIINIVLNFILIPILGIVAAAITTLIAEIVVFIITNNYSKQIINFKIDKKNILKSMLGCIGIIISCLCIDNLLILSNNIKLGIEIIVSIFVYIIVLILTRCKTIKNLLELYKK